MNANKKKQPHYWKAIPIVRKDMDVNEHERLSNIIFRHKLK
jgi:hypothetical protein